MPGAADLLRGVGLVADGPVVLGRPVRARGGVFVVELAAPTATAPLDLTVVGRWLQDLPALRLDGKRPTTRQLAARLAAFWIPSATVLFVGATDGSIGGRVAALDRHVLGDRRPFASAQWLKTLRAPTLRVWWAATAAPEEYEDAVLGAFAQAVPAEERAALQDAAVVLPFANLRTVTGEAKAHGITGSIRPEEPLAPTPAPRVVDLADGDAEGTSREVRGTGTVRRSNRTIGAARPAARPRGGATEGASKASPEPVLVSADGVARLEAELRTLVDVRRPEVIARIRSAKELGDLKENSDYHAAREEQSFLEGRIQAIEHQLRTATVVDAPDDASRIGIGSRVTVDVEGDRREITIVGSGESNPGQGRISYESPVGRALMGRSAGDEASVATPGGEVVYTILEVG
jgi:transcription elongation factor GreA